MKLRIFYTILCLKKGFDMRFSQHNMASKSSRSRESIHPEGDHASGETFPDPGIDER